MNEMLIPGGVAAFLILKIHFYIKPGKPGFITYIIV